MRAEVELAERLGISYKRLQGWEPRTTYEHDKTGRVTASYPEVEWDDTERAWMLALHAWRAEHVCPLCGLPRDVCQAPEAEFALEVPLPTRCHVTTAIKRAQAARVDSRAKAQASHDDALLWTAQFRE